MRVPLRIPIPLGSVTDGGANLRNVGLAHQAARADKRETKGLPKSSDPKGACTCIVFNYLDTRTLRHGLNRYQKAFKTDTRGALLILNFNGALSHNPPMMRVTNLTTGVLIT